MPWPLSVARSRRSLVSGRGSAAIGVQAVAPCGVETDPGVRPRWAPLRRGIGGDGGDGHQAWCDEPALPAQAGGEGSPLRNLLYRLARVLGDVEAVKKG